MKDRRPNGKKLNGTQSYSSNVPSKRGWSFQEQGDTMEEIRQIRFRGKPQHKRK